jgi:uncharacterized protein (DUF2141 family)
VFAVGISGEDLLTYKRFYPSMVYNFSYAIAASKDYDNNYDVFAMEGPLSKYVVFDNDQKHFENVPKGSWVPFGGRIELPDHLDPPGWYALFICVIEDCPTKGTVCGRTSACGQISFRVLHPGIMPMVTLIAPNVNRNEPMEFTVTVQNLGLQDIIKATGKVEVYNLEKQNVGTAYLDSKTINSSMTESLTAQFNTLGLPPGNYSATAFVDSDGTNTEANASFRIGNLDVKLVNHTETLEKGGIKRFMANVESAWNDPLNIYAKIRVYDANMSVDAKTATVALLPWKILSLESFIDTSSLEAKEYNLKIELYYAEKITTFDGKIDIVLPAVEAKNETLAPEKEEAGLSPVTLTIILVIIVIILTAVNVFLAVYRKKNP